MSFSKAKVHRFNDEKPCAPPPGAYNPGKVDKSVGPIIHKSERFHANYKLMACTSSTDSINSVSSEKGTSSTGSATFKTPKLPNSYRALSRSELKRKGDFPSSKAASVDCINKKSNHYDHDMNPLKYSLHMLEDELGIEKNKNEQLLVEFDQMRKTTSEAECFSEWLVDIIRQKNEFIDLLTEKCRALQEVSVQSFESYQKSVKNMYSILEAHHTLSSKTELDLTNVIRRYEDLVSTYEQDLESSYCFLVDLQQKQSNIAFDKTSLDDSLEQCNLLLETLKETGRGRKRYEMIISEMQKVIDVLKDRVHESDEEVRKISDVVNIINQEKAKLRTIIHSKEEEITRMRQIIDVVRQKLFHEVHNTENNLLISVDEFKEKANIEKLKYEKELARKDLIISELTNNKNKIDLQLQESLDEIEILKCKEENRQKSLDSFWNGYAMFEKNYKECCERLLDLEQTYKSCASEEELKSWKSYSRSGSNHAPLVKKIVDSLVQNNILDNNVVDRFDNVDDIEESMFVLQELLMNNFVNEHNDKSESLIHLIKAISVCSFIFVKDFCSLKNDFSRLHHDFLDKCDECGQLTICIKVSEKNLENSEKKKEEVSARLNELETKLKEQETQIATLELDNLNLKQQLDFETNAKESEFTLQLDSVAQIKCTDQTMELETSLKKERAKNEDLENRIAKLENLIGPYRSALEKFETEKKASAKANARDVQKNLKRLTQRNQELKSKIAVLQPKTGNQGPVRKNVLKEGKENHIITKNNETFEVKRTAPVVEIPMNSTYVVTSPKVSRI